MAKNKVEVFLGGKDGEQVLLSKSQYKKADLVIEDDKAVKPFVLYNRNNHPIRYKYRGDLRVAAPLSSIKLGDLSKLDKGSLHKKVMIKELK